MNNKKSIDFPFENKKYIKINELLDKQFSYYMINRMVNEGILKKINRSTYENMSYQNDDYDFLYISGYINEGVICLMSAAVYYQLSTFRPYQIDTAIKQKSKVYTLPSWPKIGLYYFSKDRYELGIETIQLEGGNFQIYDMEKTVCDLIFYRNKYGLEDTLDVLKNYLKREDRDINKLLSYSKKLRSYNIIMKYLEVLL